MTFGGRLQEERKRLGMKQPEFAHRAGIDMPKQSLYETNKRQLKAAYLSRVQPIGVDLLYVLTGQRGHGRQLDERTTRMLTAYFALPDNLRASVERLAKNLAGYLEKPKPGDPSNP